MRFETAFVRGLAAWLLAFCAAMPAGAANGDALSRLAWLGGCWSAVGGEPGSGEHWMPLAGASLLGVSRTVRDGRTFSHEFMQIRALDDGRLVFIAQPAGQATTRFLSTTVNDNEVVFENAGHDFPQRVVYLRGSGGQLHSRIEGLRSGAMRTIKFPLQRVSCDAQLASPTPAATRSLQDSAPPQALTR